MRSRLRVAVLVSGRGSNLRSLLDAAREGRMAADVVLVIASRPDAPALEHARAAGVPIVVADAPDAPMREADMARAIEAADADLVALAGYMRILGPAFIRRFEGRIVNIHPSLLPAFPGLRPQAQALAAGVRVAGCTTHFVTEDVDAGPILLQAEVPVLPQDTVETLSARILDAEHRIYPRTLHMLATGEARWDAGRVVFREGVA